MATSTTIQAAIEWAKNYSAQLSASDDRFKHWVYIVHDDGTTLMMASAFKMEIPWITDYVAVFAEHHEPLVYAKDELHMLVELVEAPPHQLPRKEGP